MTAHELSVSLVRSLWITLEYTAAAAASDDPAERSFLFGKILDGIGAMADSIHTAMGIPPIEIRDP